MATFSKLLPQESLPKWQVALLASIPIAFGLGYLYYRFNAKELIVVNKVSKDKNTAKVSDQPETNEPVEVPLSKRAENLKNEGNVCFKAGEYEKAVQFYTDAINIVPPDDHQQRATFFQNRAAAHERLNNIDKVIEDCTTALKLNPYYSKAMLRRAKAAEKQNNFDLALEDLATACILERFQNSDNVTELDRVAKTAASRDVEEFTKTHEPKLPSRFFIKTYVSTYQHGSAVDKVDVNDPVAAKLLEKLKDVEKALLSSQDITEQCTDLIEKCEEAKQEVIKAEALLLRATYYILSKQNQKAFDDLEKIITNENVDPRVRVNALIRRATLHQHSGDTKKREEDFHAAVAIDENNPDIYHHWGQIHLILDNLTESVNNFRKATALDSNFVVSAVQHCFTEYKLASLEKNANNMFHFLTEFKNIIKKFPDNIECLTLYAQVLTERQEFGEAAKLFDEAIKLEPKNAALLVHKALLVLQWKADVDTAKSLIYKALELDSDCEFAYETIATIEMQLNDLDKAVEYFNEAIKRFTSKDELMHLFCLRNSAIAQIKAEKRVGRLAMPFNFA